MLPGLISLTVIACITTANHDRALVKYHHEWQQQYSGQVWWQQEHTVPSRAKLLTHTINRTNQEQRYQEHQKDVQIAANRIER